MGSACLSAGNGLTIRTVVHRSSHQSSARPSAGVPQEGASAHETVKSTVETVIAVVLLQPLQEGLQPQQQQQQQQPQHKDAHQNALMRHAEENVHAIVKDIGETANAAEVVHLSAEMPQDVASAHGTVSNTVETVIAVDQLQQLQEGQLQEGQPQEEQLQQQLQLLQQHRSAHPNALAQRADKNARETVRGIGATVSVAAVVLTDVCRLPGEANVFPNAGNIKVATAGA